MLGRSSSWVSANRLNAVQSGADETGTVVLLKGIDTLVAGPGRSPVVVDLGNPGLATAGSGDVLTGVVGTFLAKGMDAGGAAASAAAACGVASRIAAERHGQAGMIARDVVESLARTLAVRRSRITVNLGAIRRNAELLSRAAAWPSFGPW